MPGQKDGLRRILNTKAQPAVFVRAESLRFSCDLSEFLVLKPKFAVKKLKYATYSFYFAIF
jgi:hypothetical protein